MGGVSAEREVSLRSGTAVCRALGDLHIPHVPIDADRRVCRRIIEEGIDFAVIALHGGWGEDGSIQGMLEILGVPYSGSGVLASSMAMDKEVTKKMFLQHGVQVTPFFVLDERDGDFHDDVYRSKGLDLPLFVKPSTEGSSVGASIVKKKEEFRDAVREALRFGKRVLIEKYIKGKEVQIGILGERVLGGVEVRPKQDEFYSYHAKYTSGATEYILPPELSPELYRKAQETALRANQALGCSGATRVDLIVESTGEMYALEVNTIPGMTETSLLPKIAALAGYDFKGLIREMILDSLKQRGER
ncbi:MAG: D-alanine--D-alanine ligase, partial [bacterium]